MGAPQEPDSQSPANATRPDVSWTFVRFCWAFAAFKAPSLPYQSRVVSVVCTEFEGSRPMGPSQHRNQHQTGNNPAGSSGILRHAVSACLTLIALLGLTAAA